MNIKKKIPAVCLSAALACSALAAGAGCSSLKVNTLKTPEKGLLQIAAFDGGYGLEWLNGCVEAFKDKNPGVNVTVSVMATSSNVSTAHNNVAAGIYAGDLLYDTQSPNNDAVKGYWYDLSEVYASVPDGEEKTVAEKLGEDVLKGFRYWDGNYYSMPVFDGLTGLQYNKTSLDEILGEGGWNVPVTTDELYTLCNRIIAKGHSPFIYTTETEGSYPAQFLANEYYRQTVGLETVTEAGKGKIDGVRDETGETLWEYLNANGREQAIREVSRFFTKAGGMTDSRANEMSFIQAQGYFWGVDQGQGSVNGKTKLACFQANGDWNYNETCDSFGGIKQNVDIRCMRTPVASSILELLPDASIDNDEELAALIHEIDENAAALISGAETVYYAGECVSGSHGGVNFSATWKDFQKVYAARRLYYTTMNQQLFSVPKGNNGEGGCGDFELVKKFLTFMAGDEAAYIKASCLDGISTAYRREPFEGVARNEFIKSREEIVVGGVPAFSLSTYPVYTFFNVTDLSSPQQDMYSGRYYDNCMSANTKNSMISKYKNALLSNALSIQKADELGI